MNLIPLISFVFITTFTPGPNNISSASLGVTYGYKRTLPYLFGITGGFFLIMLVCAFMSNMLLNTVPEIAKYMKYVGAIYIVYLAYGTLSAEYEVKKTNRQNVEFRKGFLLQLFNPKVAVYGITLYSTFLASLSQQLGYILISAFLFATTALCATSSWALFGAFIGRFLKNSALKKMINIVLALLLIYTAIELSEVYKFIL